MQRPASKEPPSPRFERFLTATTSIASTHEEDKLLEAIISSAKEVVEAGASSILLLDAGGKFLRFAIATGPVADKALPVKVPVAGSIAGWVVTHRQAANLATVKDDPRHYNGVDKITLLKTESLLCVPLLVDGEAIGAIQVLNKGGGKAFTDEDERFLGVIAVQAAYALRRVIEDRRRREELDELRSRMDADQTVIGEKGGLAEVFDIIRKVADTRTTVLLRGETGTGKGMIARAIYSAGSRHHRRFVTVNCSNIPPDLLESELFGHSKGAFTGATANKIGKFKLAHGGTIFLDEVGDLPLGLQTKLLRVLQDQEFEPLGSNRTEKVDVRVIAATSRNLEAAISEERFREDLYYRLNVVSLELPPLRERREDLPELVDHFLKKYSVETNKHMLRVGPEALEIIGNYDWPGNIRELENAVERAVVLGEGDVLQAEMLPGHVLGGRGYTVPEGATLTEAQRSFKRCFIAKALASYEGNQTRTAEALGIQRSYLNRLIKQLDIKELLTKG
ncbi:sigma-54-dependent Fis family transcriptional regulator [bacterium]|nr:sigma-54-dependent Fis family transcriptional regulator [bacterium]